MRTLRTIVLVLGICLTSSAYASVQQQGVNLNGVNLNGVNLNGVNLNGVNLNGVNLNGTSMSGTATTCTYTYNIRLHRFVRTCTDVTYSGYDFIGARFTGTMANGTTVTLRVDDIQPHPSHSDVMLYTISAYSSGSWQNVCQADPRGWRKAIPVAGYWTSTGAHVSSSTQFTISCTTGVIAKCVEWGYKPWTGRFIRSGYTFKYVSMWGYHQTCTRMARADYCGTGTPHTISGTAIDIEDTAGVQAQDPYWYGTVEGGWDENGAVCLRAGWRLPSGGGYEYCPVMADAVGNYNCSSFSNIKYYYPSAKLMNER